MFVFVTSFSPNGYKQYGERFLRGFEDNMPKDYQLYVFYEHEKPNFKSNRIHMVNLFDDPEHNAFFERHKDIPERNGLMQQPDGKYIQNYRFAAVRFSHKVYAITNKTLPRAQWRIWLDADTVFRKPVPKSFFPELLSDNKAVAYYIGRKPHIWHTSECSFVAYNLEHQGSLFLTQFRELYNTDKVFDLGEWHDSYIFDTIRQTYEGQGEHFVDIAADLELFDPQPQTILGKYWTHLKGQMSKANPDKIDLNNLLVGCKSRYEQIPRLISAVKPKTIVEVGTWTGDRAIIMATEALKHQQFVHYIGFDLFEDQTEEDNKRELNVKKKTTLEEIGAKLSEFQSSHPGFSYELVKGDTRTTLPNFTFDREIDFVWLDGGHSVETIRNDYESVKGAKFILFDDFYLAGVDTSKYGCNQILGFIPHIILPVYDKFGEMQIALAMTGDWIKENIALPENKQGQAVNIKTKNCVPDDVIKENVKYASKFTNIVKYVDQPGRPNNIRAVIVGGSPSVLDPTHSEYKSNWERIRKEAKKKNTLIYGVKTSYDALVEKKIIPHGCFLLDPRDHVKNAVNNPQKETIFFIASMCDKTTWDYYVSNGYNCIGYHASVGAGEIDAVREHFNGGLMIHGGSTSGTRGMHLLWMIGFRKFTFIGFDSSYEKKPQKAHGRSEKPLVDVMVHGKTFITDPELIAQSQDVEMMCKMYPFADIEFVGNGMLQHAASIIRTFQEANPGVRELVEPAFSPYTHAIKDKNPAFEVVTIDNAIKSLLLRQKKLNTILEKLPMYEDIIRLN